MVNEGVLGSVVNIFPYLYKRHPLLRKTNLQLTKEYAIQ